MTAGSLQRHVAITFHHGARPNNTILIQSLVFGRAKGQSSRRWQSTAAKQMTETEHVQPLSKSNEIPIDCFLDANTIPTPSLKRVQPITTVDLGVTRPAKLDSPPSLERRDYADGNIPIGDRAKYLFKLGKSFLLFYKTGLKNVWSNSKQYRAIRSKLQGHTLNNIAKYGGQTIDGKLFPSISRSEYQLSIRTRHDLFKMIPFSLVFLICGEFTPLVIVALGSVVVPYTCRIPRQTQKDLEKRILQDKNYNEDLPRVHADPDTPLETTSWQLEHLEAYRLGLTSLRNPIPLLGSLYHSLITRPRLTRHLDNLVSSTLLIHREGGASNLAIDDLYEWAEHYGLYAFRLYVEECQLNGYDVKTEKFRTALLPRIDAEIKYMLDQAGDWSRLKPEEQWRIALRTVGSQSADWKARVLDIRKHWKQA